MDDGESSDSLSESDEELDPVVPCTTSLLTGHQFRTMMERDVAPKKPAAVKPKPKPKGAAALYSQMPPHLQHAPAGKGIHAARGGGGGVAEDYYAKMMEAKELAKQWQDDVRDLTRKLHEEQHAAAELRQRHETLLAHVESGGAPSLPGTKAILQENVRLQKRIHMLTDRTKAKTAELEACKAKLERNPRKAKLAAQWASGASEGFGSTNPGTASGGDVSFMTPAQQRDASGGAWTGTHGTRSTQPHRTGLGGTHGGLAVDSTNASTVVQGGGHALTTDEAALHNVVLKKSQTRIKDLKKERKALQEEAQATRTWGDTLFGKFWFTRLAWEAASRRNTVLKRRDIDLTAALDKQRVEFESKLKKAEQAVETLERSSTTHKDRAVALQGLLNKRNESSTQQHSAAAHLQHDYAALLETHATAVDAKDQEIQSLRNEILTLDKELRIAQANARHDEKSMEAKTAALFKKDVQERDGTIARLEREVKNLTEMNRELTRDTRALKHTTETSLASRDESATRRQEAYEKKSSSLQDKVASLTEEVGTLKKERFLLEKEVKVKDKQIAQLKQMAENQRLERRAHGSPGA